MAVRRLNHAVLYVHDLASAVDFYTATLGFEVRSEMAGRAAFLRAPGSANDHDLGLFALDGASPIPRDAAARVGLYHLAWEVGTLAELDEVRRRLAERGALVGASDHRVSKSLYAKDPQRHRVRGDVAGARRGLGGGAIQRPDDRPAGPGGGAGPLG